MNQGKVSTNRHGHLFTVEILIEETTNGLALEKLLHLLNTDQVRDYKILKGIDLGQLIEVNARGHSSPEPSALLKEATASTSSQRANEKVIEQLEQFKNNNTLVRLTVIKAKGIKLNLPCRILNYDSGSQNVTVYHVDEKKVYSFKLNEIDDYMATV